MESAHSAGATAVITRVAEQQWQAVAEGRVIGRGDASTRPDGRIFVSVDSWHGEVFDRLADAMLADLAMPLHTLVDEADLDTTARWARVGFTIARRERDYLVTTAPVATALPSGMTLVPPGEVVASAPQDYALTDASGHCVGVVRVTLRRTHARIGLIEVRPDARRHGIGRALLTEVLKALRHKGVETASAIVDEADAAAVALFEGVGARHTSSDLELVNERSAN
ncbi:GNAT family N-acetyltransferase [Allokutzneria sp. NRRL B-24872]|uniref:GNAT family N-acetyltransferase n=1 Tax=Allokutzneria sp. NRRL B-24872 TaxID=1137961 RepID=UPI000A376871|nr:GNAT family N-acetyltransferase [Allokutzneria sp. NRRL B-24872]